MKALISHLIDTGVSFDYTGTMDGNPDQTIFSVIPVDCTLTDYLRELEAADTDCAFVVFNDGRVSHLGGFVGAIEVGRYLCVEAGRIFDVATL